MTDRQLNLQHEILGILWHDRDRLLDSGLPIRHNAEVISDTLEISITEASTLLKDLALRHLINKRRGESWEYNYNQDGAHAYMYERLLNEAYLNHKDNMTPIDYEECDKIMRYYYERLADTTVHIWCNVYKELEIERGKANLHLQFLTDDEMLGFFGKGSGGIDDEYIEITRKGRQFFTRTSYTEESNQRSKAQGGVTYNIHVASNNGNMIVDSTFKDAIITLKNGNADSVVYLETIKELIANSKNQDAIHLFDKFNEEVAKPKKDSRMINLLWKGIESAIPHVPKLVEQGHKLLQSLHVY
jgi:hypothetical protein